MAHIISIKPRQQKPILATLKKLSFDGQPIHRLISEPPSKMVLQSVWRSLWQKAGRPQLLGGTEYAIGEHGCHVSLSGGLLQGKGTRRRTTAGLGDSMEISLSAFGENVSGLFALYFGHRSLGENVEVSLDMNLSPIEQEIIHNALGDLLDLHREAGIAHFDHEMLSSFNPQTYEKALAKSEKETLHGNVRDDFGTSKRRRL